MKLIEELSYNNTSILTELGSQIGLTGSSFDGFFEKMGLSCDDYKIKYFKNSQGEGCKQYFLNGAEVCSSVFGETLMAHFNTMEIKSKKLREISFVHVK